MDQLENSVNMTNIKEIEKICEELRLTRYKSNNKPAFEYIYQKYKDSFISFDHFLKVAHVYAIFFASQGEKTKEIREKSVYKFID